MSEILLSLLIATSIIHMMLIFELTPVSVVHKGWADFPDDPDGFTVIALPDTQMYSEWYPEVFDNQTQWIINNIDRLNIVFVTHLGDIVEDWNVVEQWENANRSMSKLDGEVPWGILPGNHDIVDSNETNYVKYFGTERFIDENWYGGAYQNSNANNYQLFSAGGDDYLIFHLQYNPTNETLQWASAVVDSYPNRRVIVSTHYYLQACGEPRRSSVGENIWQTLIEPHADQVFLVLCGHMHTEAYRTVTSNGHVICEVLSDYQEESNGGNGWLKAIHFSSKYDKIFVKTYSPYLNRFDYDFESDFILDYSMTSSR